jgi:biopolymer transport protein ExbB/TolQ
VARIETARKHAMHAAVAIGLVGLLGTVSRLGPAFAEGGLARPAVVAQLITAGLLAAYVALGVKSFIDARRSR